MAYSCRKEDQQQKYDVLLDPDLHNLNMSTVHKANNSEKNGLDIHVLTPGTDYVATNTFTDNQWQILKKSYNKYYHGNKRVASQHALAVIFYNDFIDVIPEERPNQRSKPCTHTEQILIDKIEKSIEQNTKNGKTVLNILIYTLNSPCLKRVDPCFFLLKRLSDKLHQKYNICINVFFTNYYGPITKQNFKNFTFSKMSNAFHEYHEDVSFEFLWEHFDKKCEEILKQMFGMLEKIERNDFKNLFLKCIAEVRDLVKKFDLKINTGDECCDKVEDVINSFKFPPQISKNVCDQLLKNVLDTREISPMKLDKNNSNRLLSEMKYAIVKCFLEFFNSNLGENSHLRLYHVTHDMLCQIE